MNIFGYLRISSLLAILRKIFLRDRRIPTAEQAQIRQKTQVMKKTLSDPRAQIDSEYPCLLCRKDEGQITEWLIEQYEKQQPLTMLSSGLIDEPKI